MCRDPYFSSLVYLYHKDGSSMQNLSGNTRIIGVATTIIQFLNSLSFIKGGSSKYAMCHKMFGIMVSQHFPA